MYKPNYHTKKKLAFIKKCYFGINLHQGFDYGIDHSAGCIIFKPMKPKKQKLKVRWR